METLTEKLNHDPHIGKPIPGQSLTATPGSMPYEKPPISASVEDSFLALKAGLYESEERQREIGEITRAGVSCETLAGSMVMMGFSQGMFNPDVAEMIKPFLAVEIFKIAKDQGIDQVILENKPIDKGLDRAALDDLQQDALPNNQYDVEFTPEELAIIHNEPTEDNSDMPQEGFMSKPKEVEKDGI